MNQKRRRAHPNHDGVWMLPDADKLSPPNVQIAVLMDLRAVLHDLLDEQKKTNRILAETFGWSDK